MFLPKSFNRSKNHFFKMPKKNKDILPYWSVFLLTFFCPRKNSEIFVRWPVPNLWVRAHPHCHHCEASRGQRCYQSPQQRITRLSGALDVWSLGCLVPWMFEALERLLRKHGRAPWQVSWPPKRQPFVFQSSFFRAVKLRGPSKGLGPLISNFRYGTRLHGIHQVPGKS